MKFKKRKIPPALQGFNRYCIEKQQHTPKTAVYQCFITAAYLEWLKEQSLNLKQAGYSNLLDYIGHLQQQGKSKSSINACLKGISHYYTYKKIPDMAKDVQLRGVLKIAPNYLTEEELQRIYDAFVPFATKGYYHYSNKIILGLMIYQGLDRGDILKLELTHLNLERGSLYVPGGCHTKNERILPLAAHQIMPLKQYIDHYRKPFYKADTNISDKLFSPSCNKKESFQKQLKAIFKAIKRNRNTHLINLKRLYLLRQSRIAIWVKQYGMRKAQYLAGFRSVHSLEIYKANDVSDLQEHINLYHPLNK